jgi:penicillin-binding protein 1C
MGGGSKTRTIIEYTNKNRKTILIFILSAGLILWFWFSLPKPLFQDPTSTVLQDYQGELLSARIAADGQWRFPENNEMPEKFEQAILQFEDRHFYKHPGVNPLSLIRAIRQNVEAGKIVSGGSTITMQLIRLSRKGKPRTIFQKLIEMILALRAELRYSKEEILALYASHAPFGGNVVGLEAASWRYYNRPPSNLSWAETAALAVLPNAPALIYPGKNNEAFRKKRDWLLKKLRDNQIIDPLTYELAVEEPLPDIPHKLPQLTPHLTNRAIAEGYRGELITTSINSRLQHKISQIIEKHHQQLQHNEIHNAAALVLDVETGNALAYIGNTSDPGNKHNNRVDVISAPRSSGSILKPLLYAAMLSDGEILKNTLVPDIPTQIGGYSPKNFDEKYDGAVPASEALYRSLNVPSVRMLQDYGLEKFYHKLKKLELSTLSKPPDHYGLSLILGGSEVTLWEITGIYASMARTLNHFRDFHSQYHPGDYHEPQYLARDNSQGMKQGTQESSIFSAASIWTTFDVLTELHRPREEAGWEILGSTKKIAWKTGTSFGFRDGWSVGVTPHYAIGVWVGNADGEGRPGLTGLNVAAPILFDILSVLPDTRWFDPPYDELKKIPVCRKSGHKAGRYCDAVDTVFITGKGTRTPACPFHQLVHLDRTGTYRVNSQCEDIYQMKHKPWFVLPPVMEWYYKRSHGDYVPLPPIAPDCQTPESPMEMVHPKYGAQVFIPVELDGTPGELVFRAAHRIPESTIYWHLDKTYIGKTHNVHEMTFHPGIGNHKLHLVDNKGNTTNIRFQVVKK